MRTSLLIITLAIGASLSAQTKKVLLEEFTGAHCGICPNGAYYADSMLTMHPDLIAVAIHTYGVYDAMVFPEIDTIGITYAQGAPLGAVDRICPSPPSNNTGQYISTWDNNITQRELQTAPLTVNVSAGWNGSTRNISALVTVNMLANLPTADYRVSLYVVEDSVTGTGSGYDQANTYDQISGSHWYGLGDPIVGYVHRHVARALLPNTWGQGGVLPSTPMNGQSFTTMFNYTLPAGYDENQVSVVAFVTRFSSNHETDEVLNAEEVKLLGATDIQETTERPYVIYVNPPDLFFIQTSLQDAQYEVHDVLGRIISQGSVTTGTLTTVDLRGNKPGMYFIRIFTREDEFSEKLLIEYSLMR